jgi:hypothetical protein
METKISAERVEDLRIPLGYAGCFAMNSDGLSGGLGLFWSRDYEVDVKSYSIGHIDAMVRKKDQFSPVWRFTGFYGAPRAENRYHRAPRAENRYHSWRFLRTLFGVLHSAWLCMGDFNETLYASEHFSRAARPEWQMRNFRDAVDDCQLQDLGWSGTAYTWDNRQAGDANVKARLDRALANSEFLIRFEHTRVRHIVATESDHCFVLVELRERLSEQRTSGAKLFRYENVWQTHADYDKLVKDSWEKGAGQRGLVGVVDALQNLQAKLSSWGTEEFGCLPWTVRKLRQKLNSLRAKSVGRGQVRKSRPSSRNSDVPYTKRKFGSNSVPACSGYVKGT